MNTHAFRAHRASAHAALAAALVFFAVGCGDRSGGGGTLVYDTGSDADAAGTPDAGEEDIPAIPDVPATEGSIKALQLESEGTACDPQNIMTIKSPASVTGVVITSPKFDAFTPEDPEATALDGYFIADQDGGKWSGIQVVFDRTKETDFQPGDVLDVDGELVEFYCFSQLKADTWTDKGTAPVPAPVLVAPDKASDEAFEGMLLQVKGVKKTAEPFSGVYEVTGGLVIDHVFDLFLELLDDYTYDITGQLGYAYDEYRLYPRTYADIVVVDRPGLPEPNTTIKEIQQATTSVDCTDEGNNTIASDLIFDGVVVGPRYDVSANLHGYYLSDGTQDPYSGVLVVIGKNKNTDFAIGTRVRVAGSHKEFYCLTEISATEMDEIGPGTAPDPVPLAEADLCAALEQWEGVIVEITDQKVKDVSELTSKGFVDLESCLLLDSDMLDKSVLDGVQNGTAWDMVRGAIRYSFSAYRISPRDAADLIVGSGPGDEVAEVEPDAMVTDAADAGETELSGEDVSEPGPEVGPETTETGAETEPGPETATEPGPETVTEPGPEAAAETAPETQPEPMPEATPDAG